MSRIALSFVAATMYFAALSSTRAQDSPRVGTAGGVRLLVVAENSQPALRIVLPCHVESDRSIEVLFPEHVTAMKQEGVLRRVRQQRSTLR